MNTKDKIYEEAVKIFAKDGFEKASVDRIAAKSKIAKGTIYYYFKSKDDIFLEMIDNGISKFNRAIEERMEGLKSPKDKLENLLTIQFDYYEKYKDFYKVLFSEFWRLEPKWKKEIDKIREGYFSMIKEIIEEGKKDKSFRKDLDSSAVALSIFSLFAFGSLGWIVFGRKIKKKKMYEALSSIYYRGIRQ
jgi:TetR/AcrR family transcriptional regulator